MLNFSLASCVCPATLASRTAVQISDLLPLTDLPPPRKEKIRRKSLIK